MNKLDCLIYIGRFQPCHLAHIKTIQIGLQQANKLLILIGSSNQPKTIKDPWTWQERACMILESLSEDDQNRVSCVPIEDYTYNDQRWVSQVQQKVSIHTTPEQSIGVIGHTKDETSFYLKMFPQWKHIEVDNIDDVNATDIRNVLLSITSDNFADDATLNKLPKAIHDYLYAWSLKAVAEELRDEFDFIQKYKQAWSPAPYEPIFVTVDAVVIQSGHILLIRRRAAPGAKLWALPGGFLNPNEYVEHAMFRELREETKIKVPEPVLRGNVTSTKVFDAPNRSLRGRTITHAYYIKLPPGELPKVKGSDDADKAKWIPLNTFAKMRDQLFEDHYHIINYFIGD